MKLANVASGAFDSGGEWALEFPTATGFKLHLVTFGEAWLSVAGARKKVRLAAGDCALITNGRATIISNTATPRAPLALSAVKRDAQNGVVRLGLGGDCFSLGLQFGFDGHLPDILFARLPPVIHVEGARTDAARLRAHVEEFRAEYVRRGVGRSFLLHHLAPIILLQIVRVYLASATTDRNWLTALSDVRLSCAFDAIHARYQEEWSVVRLAKLAGMSRSGFALRFRNAAGIGPMDYLASWRIQMACAQLRETNDTIAAIASAVGYASTSAFSTAFTRALRCRPGVYRARTSIERGAESGPYGRIAEARRAASGNVNLAAR